MTKYRTQKYGSRIEEFEVNRETNVTIWFNTEWQGKVSEERQAKKSTYHNWFDTFEEAKDFLIDSEKRKILGFESQLETSKERLKEIMELENE